MSVTAIFATGFYLATVILCAGISFKVFKYICASSRFLIPIGPAPRSRTGVVLRIMREVFLFESLFRASKWTWLFGWIFHYALALVLVRHLFFVTDSIWPWMVWMFPIGDFAAWAMVLALLGLFGRRILVDRVRYISSPSDFAMLALIIGIGITGLLLRYEIHTDLFAVRGFVIGLRDFSPGNLPANWILYIHLAATILLAAIFPFSKLIHFPGLLFSPSHTQKSS